MALERKKRGSRYWHTSPGGPSKPVSNPPYYRQSPVKGPRGTIKKRYRSPRLGGAIGNRLDR